MAVTSITRLRFCLCGPPNLHARSHLFSLIVGSQWSMHAGVDSAWNETEVYKRTLNESVRKRWGGTDREGGGERRKTQAWRVSSSWRRGGEGRRGREFRRDARVRVAMPLRAERSQQADPTVLAIAPATREERGRRGGDKYWTRKGSFTSSWILSAQ